MQNRQNFLIEIIGKIRSHNYQASNCDNSNAE